MKDRYSLEALKKIGQDLSELEGKGESRPLTDEEKLRLSISIKNAEVVKRNDEDELWALVVEYCKVEIEKHRIELEISWRDTDKQTYMSGMLTGMRGVLGMPGNLIEQGRIAQETYAMVKEEVEEKEE